MWIPFNVWFVCVMCLACAVTSLSPRARAQPTDSAPEAAPNLALGGVLELVFTSKEPPKFGFMPSHELAFVPTAGGVCVLELDGWENAWITVFAHRGDRPERIGEYDPTIGAPEVLSVEVRAGELVRFEISGAWGGTARAVLQGREGNWPTLELSGSEERILRGVLTADDPAPVDGARRDRVVLDGVSEGLLSVVITPEGEVDGVRLLISDEDSEPHSTVSASPGADGTAVLRWRMAPGQSAEVQVSGTSVGTAYALRASQRALHAIRELSLERDETVLLEGNAGAEAEVYGTGVHRVRVTITPTTSGVLYVDRTAPSNVVDFSLHGPVLSEDETYFYDVAWSDEATGTLTHRVTAGVRYELVIDRPGPGPWASRVRIEPRKPPFFCDDIALGGTSVEIQRVLGFSSGVEDDGTLIDQHVFVPETDGLLEVVCETESFLAPISLVRLTGSDPEVIALAEDVEGGHQLTRLVVGGERYAIVVRDRRSMWEEPGVPSSLESEYRLRLTLKEVGSETASSQWRPILRSAASSIGITPLASPDARFVAIRDFEGVRVIDTASRLPIGFVRGGTSGDFVWGGSFLACDFSSGETRLFALRRSAANGLPASYDPESSLLEIDVERLIREWGVPASRASRGFAFSPRQRRLVMEGYAPGSNWRHEWVTVMEFNQEGDGRVIFEDEIAKHIDADVNGMRVVYGLRFDAIGSYLAGRSGDDGDGYVLYHADLETGHVTTRSIPEEDDRGGKLRTGGGSFIPMPNGRHVLLERRNDEGEWWTWCDLERGEVTRTDTNIDGTRYDMWGVLTSGEGFVAYPESDVDAPLKICMSDGAVRDADDTSLASIVEPYRFDTRDSPNPWLVKSLFRVGVSDHLIDLHDLAGAIRRVEVVGGVRQGRFLRVRFGYEAGGGGAVIDLASMRADSLGTDGAWSGMRSRDWRMLSTNWKGGVTSLRWQPWWDATRAPTEIARWEDESQRWTELYTPRHLDHRAFQQGAMVHFVDWTGGVPRTITIQRADDERVRQAQLDPVFGRALIWAESKRLEMYSVPDGVRISFDTEAFEERYSYLARDVLPSLRMIAVDAIMVDSVVLTASGRAENLVSVEAEEVVRSGDGTLLALGSMVGRAAQAGELSSVWPGSFLDEWEAALIVADGAWRLPEGFTPVCFVEGLARLIAVGPRNELAFWDVESGEKLFSVGIDRDLGVFAILPDGRYTGPRRLGHMLGFTDGVDVLPARALDAQFNRPGEVFEAVGLAPPERVSQLKGARERRLSGLGSRVAEPSAPAPELLIDPPLRTPGNAVELVLEPIADGEELRVIANGRFLPEESASSRADGTAVVRVPLVPGTNRIALWTLANGGRSSERSVVIECDISDSVTTTWFLGVGVSDYADSLMDLDFAAKDTLDLAHALGAIAPGEFRSRVLMNGDATRERVLRARSFLEEAEPGDRIFVHVAGHGLLTEDGTYRFATHDTEFDRPDESGLGFGEIEGLLSGLPTPEVYLFMDTCHAGELEAQPVLVESTVDGVYRRSGLRGATLTGFGGSETVILTRVADLFTDLRDNSGVTVYAASSGEQYAIERNDVRNGVFTRAVIEGLAMGAADRDGDAIVDREELRQFLIARVDEMTSGAQRPQIRRESADVQRPVARALQAAQQLTADLDDLWSIRRVRMGATGPMVVLYESSDGKGLRMFDRVTGATLRDVMLVEQGTIMSIDIHSVGEDGTTLLDDGRVVSPRHGLIEQPEGSALGRNAMVLSRSGAFVVRVGTREFAGSLIITDLRAEMPKTERVPLADSDAWGYTSSVTSAALGAHPDAADRVQVSVNGYVLDYDPVSRAILRSSRVPWIESAFGTYGEFLDALSRDEARVLYSAECGLTGRFSASGRYLYRHAGPRTMPDEPPCPTLIARRDADGSFEIVREFERVESEQPLMETVAIETMLGIRSLLRDGSMAEELGSPVGVRASDVLVEDAVIARRASTASGLPTWFFVDLSTGTPIGWFRGDEAGIGVDRPFRDGIGGVWIRQRNELLRFTPVTRP